MTNEKVSLMERHPNDRFMEAMREMMPGLRSLIPKYFGHLIKPGEDWEVRYPGALCIAEFGGTEKRAVLHDVPDPDQWWPYAEAKLVAMKTCDADASITLIDPAATPPIYAGGLRNGRLKHGFRSFAVLTGGPQIWDHVATGGGMIRSHLGNSRFINWNIHSWRGSGVQQACEQSGLSEEVFNSLVAEVHGMAYSSVRRLQHMRT